MPDHIHCLLAALTDPPENGVERGFGVIKRRFACLHNELRLEPKKVSKVIELW